MPNWVKGNLKIRGKKENVINFIENGTSLIEGIWDSKKVQPQIEINEWGEIKIKNIDVEKQRDCLYIKDTTRHFIDPIKEEICINDEDKEECIICLKNFKSAWKINTEELREISEKYNIDIKIYGFEAGMEFNQDIEIIKGKIIRDRTINFGNYYWECIEPDLGG